MSSVITVEFLHVFVSISATYMANSLQGKATEYLLLIVSVVSVLYCFLLASHGGTSIPPLLPLVHAPSLGNPRLDSTWQRMLMA